MSVGEDQLHALEWGRGAQLLIAFHGYSNNAALFESLAQQLAGDFTTIAIDLPGHGHTRWPAGKLLTAANLVRLTQDLGTEKGVEKAAFTAFSLGGRVALSVFSEQPELVSQMVLAAPDGLSPNWLQRFALSSGIGKKFTQDLVKNPARYQRLLDQLHRRGILPPARYQFLQHHLGNSTATRRVQEGLLPLRKLTPSVSRLRRQILQTGIPVHLLMGEADTVIPIVQGQVFVKGLPSAMLHRLHKGHRLFDGDTVGQMARLLRAPL